MRERQQIKFRWSMQKIWVNHRQMYLVADKQVSSIDYKLRQRQAVRHCMSPVVAAAQTLIALSKKAREISQHSFPPFPSMHFENCWKSL